MTDFANAVIQWGATPDEITLLALMKQTMGIDDDLRDAELSMFLDMAGVAAEQYIDNIIEQREVTERISKERTPVALRYYPVTDVTSILIDGVETVGEFTQGFDDGIAWSIKGVSTFAKSISFKQMDITYTAGFNPIPSQIGYAIVRSAMLYEANATVGGPIKKQVVDGVGSIEYDTSGTETAGVGLLGASAVAALDPYRRIHA